MKKLVFRFMLCVSLLTLVGASATACGSGEGNPFDSYSVITPVAAQIYGQYMKDNGDTVLIGNPDFYQIQNVSGETVEEGIWSIDGDKIVLSESDGYFNMLSNGKLKDNLGNYWSADLS